MLIYSSLGNDFNDNENKGPEDLIYTIGFNLGFGGKINLYTNKL